MWTLRRPQPIGLTRKKKTDLDEPKASLASSPPDSSPTSPSVEKSAGWMQAIKPSGTADAVMDAEQSPSAESTGMLAGLTGLLPAEKMATTTPTLEPKTSNSNGTDTVLEAAQSFYAIATQAPQPATLPTPTTQPDEKQFPKNLIRTGVFLLFILLVAIPLLPGFQKAADPDTGRQAPWTEPGGELNDVLSSRRSQLIGNELGIIDLQQPDSVALVSFDYSAGTQGEMQPLAEAILGRLRGQGMRVILMSLEPEGATLAQTVLNQRDETYGENVVNLGYMPGQMMAARALASGQKQLSTVPDYQEGLTFANDNRANWQDVENLQQIDIIVTLADNPATARWWIEQMQMAAPADSGEQYLLGATSAVAEPFLQPYRNADQLDGLIAGINGAAAIEAGRRQFGPARQMLDSQSLAHLLIIILIAAGTIAGWMPKLSAESNPESEEE